MRRLGFAVLGAVAGFVVGAGATALLVSALSSNAYDRSLEVVMTAFFVGGPLGAIVGGIIGFVRGRNAS